MAAGRHSQQSTKSGSGRRAETAATAVATAVGRAVATTANTVVMVAASTQKR